jgi:hypothetical protein
MTGAARSGKEHERRRHEHKLAQSGVLFHFAACPGYVITGLGTWSLGGTIGGSGSWGVRKDLI